MAHDIRKLCYDILLAVKEIKEFVRELSFEDYCRNRQVKLAVEREYEIIGEALRRMQIDSSPNSRPLRMAVKSLILGTLLLMVTSQSPTRLFGA